MYCLQDARLLVALMLRLLAQYALLTAGNPPSLANSRHLRYSVFGDLAQETPVEATHWGRWARQLPLPAEFTVLVAPPLVGGIVVGSLRALTQFDKPGVGAVSSPPSASNPLKVPLY